MSNEVYGYLQAPDIKNKISLLKSLQEKSGVGIKSIPFSELFSFPQDVMPKNEDVCVAFIIGDRPGKVNTSYLTDYLDYDQKADIGFPCNGKERLGLLVSLFLSMIKESKANRFVVAITDSSQIEQVKKIYLGDLKAEIYKDFDENAPPDCLYDVCIK